MDFDGGGGSSSSYGLGHGINNPSHTQPQLRSATAAPAIPPRPGTTAVSSYRGTLGSSNYGYSMPSPYYGSVGYNGYMSPMGGYNGYGISGAGNYSSTASDLEATWRQTFSSIESVVRTCSSITVMLDSTYFALFNCFRAVIGLGEHFSDVKAQLGRICLPVIQWALRLVRFVLRLLGLSHLFPSHFHSLLSTSSKESELLNAWASSSNSNNSAAVPTDAGHHLYGDSSLSSVLYMLAVFGLPLLVWKVVSLSVQRTSARRQWFMQPHPAAVAQYDFTSTRSDELCFLRGSKIHLAPLEQQPYPQSGWLLATVDGRKFGMVPKNYLSAPTMSKTATLTTKVSAEADLQSQSAVANAQVNGDDVVYKDEFGDML